MPRDASLPPLAAGVFAMLLAGCASDGGARPASGGRSPGGTVKEAGSAKTEAARVNTELGQKYMAQGKLELALEKLTRALQNDPRYVDAHTVIAVLYETINEQALAEEHYRRATQLKPKSGSEANNYGAYLCKIGRYDEAATYFERAITDPFYQTPVVALTNAGTCAIKGGKFDAAERDLKLALDRGPDNAEALFQMAMVLYRKDDFFRARAFIQRYESLGQPSPESLLLGRNIELRLGNADAATDYTRRLRQNFPESEQARSLDAPSSS
ncbi:type IV pilus biogenesis/stability protein PilW [Dokdonella sp. MW10]|uniref:type IV pilus biogenesis/stability protein PilW n=1 Tax=Dokdonella sp. MW10 TaxID=2992926 RepID=UPI003F7E12FC